MALSIPLLIVIVLSGYVTQSFSLVPLGVVLLIGVLPNPAAAGLQYMTHELAEGEIMTFSDVWWGLRKYWVPALRSWLTSLIVTVLLLANVIFYARAVTTHTSTVHAVAGPLEALWIALLLFWLLLHLYVFPLLMVQESPGLLTTYRNAALMVAARPFFTIIAFPIWIILLSFTAATGLATIIGLAIGAAIQQNAVARLIPTFPGKPSQCDV